MLRTIALLPLAFSVACAAETPSSPPVVPTTVATASSSAPLQSGRPAALAISEARSIEPSPTRAVELPPPPAGLRRLPIASAAVPFAHYLNGIHNRIHPQFADIELAKLDALPKEDPLNDKKLSTRVELVLDATDGHILTMNVFRSSGLTAFDMLSLDSVRRAEPFGPASAPVTSVDGHVHLVWEFRRDEVFACSTMHAYPLLYGP